MKIKNILTLALTLWASALNGAERSHDIKAASSPPSGASLEERRAVARSVRVITGILGVELGSTLENAHAKLDRLGDPERPTTKRKEREEGSVEYKVLWQMKETDFSSVYVKADGEKHIEYITGFLRPGRELPFNRIGEVGKAPVRSDTTVVWDVLRPKRKPMRVVATGQESRASVIKLFIVRSSRPGSADDADR